MHRYASNVSFSESEKKSMQQQHSFFAAQLDAKMAQLRSSLSQVPSVNGSILSIFFPYVNKTEWRYLWMGERRSYMGNINGFLIGSSSTMAALVLGWREEYWIWEWNGILESRDKWKIGCGIFFFHRELRFFLWIIVVDV